MGYTKQMAEENRAMKKRAAELLQEYGWNYDEERKHTDEYGQNLYHREMCERIGHKLSQEFPAIAWDRIRHQVHGAIHQARGKAIREKRQKQGE
jgi:heterodisulfide reductase subunit B